MPLTALVGGGIPAFDSTMLSTGDGLSTNPPHVLGTLASDSSGGVYVMGRGTGSTAQKQGCVVTLDSSVGVGCARLPTTAGITSTAGGAIGITKGGSTNSTVGVSTSQYCWYQVYGPGEVLGGSTSLGGGTRLYLSTATVGAVTTSSGSNPGAPAAISGLVLTSSNASSIVNCFINYPRIPSAV